MKKQKNNSVLEATFYIFLTLGIAVLFLVDFWSALPFGIGAILLKKTMDGAYVQSAMFTLAVWMIFLSFIVEGGPSFIDAFAWVIYGLISYKFGK